MRLSQPLSRPTGRRGELVRELGVDPDAIVNEAYERGVREIMTMDYSMIERRIASRIDDMHMREMEHDARVRDRARRMYDHMTDAILYGVQSNNRG